MAVRTPTLGCGAAASLAMTNLRAELDHRSGEDGRTTIEHRRERCRYLNGDYDTPKAAPAGHATHSPSSPGTMGGSMALALHLQMVV
jgi:hypothetical protein